MPLKAIVYARGELKILDQLRLPYEEVYIQIKDPQNGWDAIKAMQVRGAPAIAIVAALSLAVYLARPGPGLSSSIRSTADLISRSLKFLVTSRPTAVNLLTAAKELERVAYAAASEPKATPVTVTEAYIKAAESMLIHDVQDNENIGKYGAEWIEAHCLASPSQKQLSVITHCNTGSLATAGYGTALGVIRSLHTRGTLAKVFYTETRPYNQGAKLTGFELIHDNIPCELITDSMAAALMKIRKNPDKIACVVVGADRVAANGDTANKIGTYSLAILARHHGVKFLVAAPRTTIDRSTLSGEDITIEQRPMREVTRLKGPQIQKAQDGKNSHGLVTEIEIAHPQTRAWNPSFDVTPAELIDGIITEVGVVERSSDGRFYFDDMFKSRAQTKTNHDGAGDIENSTDLPWNEVVKMKADEVQQWASWIKQT